LLFAQLHKLVKLSFHLQLTLFLSSHHLPLLLSEGLILLLHLLAIDQLGQLLLLTVLACLVLDLCEVLVGNVLFDLFLQLLLFLDDLWLPLDPLQMMPLEQTLERPVSLLLDKREVPQCMLFGCLDDQLIQALLALHKLLVVILWLLDPDVVLSGSHDP